MLRKIVLFIFAVFIIYGLSGNNAFMLAFQNPTEEMARKIKTREELCIKANKRISKILRNYTENKTRHNETYARIRKKVSDIIEKLRSQGLDVSVLENDLEILDEKTKKYQTDLENFVKTVENTNSFVCGDNKGQYLSTIIKVRDQLRIVRKDKADIRIFIEETIKTHIKETMSEK